MQYISNICLIKFNIEQKLRIKKIVVPASQTVSILQESPRIDNKVGRNSMSQLVNKRMNELISDKDVCKTSTQNQQLDWIAFLLKTLQNIWQKYLIFVKTSS